VSERADIEWWQRHQDLAEGPTFYCSFGLAVKIFDNPAKWLVAAAVCFAGLFIAYGHAALPLVIVAPAVWVNWGDADIAMRWIAGGSALGVVAMVASLLLGRGTSLRLASMLISITALVASAAIAMAVTEVWPMTAFTSVPFVMCVGGFAASTMRQRRSVL
jgi:hypothetical protein